MVMRTGIYYSATRNEVTSILDSEMSLDGDWQHLTADSSLGLLAVRKLLVERGVGDAGEEVYWYLPQPEEQDATPPAPPACAAPDTKPAKPGRFARLRATFGGAS